MRISVARRNLLRQPTRLLISVGGVGFAVMLILLVFGLYSGVKTQAGAYLGNVPADVWIVQGGTSGDLFHGVSLVPRAAADRVQEVEGVRSVQPFLARPVVFDHEETETSLMLVGVDPADPLTAPAHVTRGQRVPGDGEIVVDRVFARTQGIGIGDGLTIKGERLQVVGLSTRTNVFTSQFGFVPMAEATRILQSDLGRLSPELEGFADAITSSFIVRGDGAPEELASRIGQAVPEVQPLTHETFLAANIEELEEGVLPLLWVIVLVVFGVGTAVIALTIYTATLERRREYGVLKAIGFSNRRLYRVVGEQSVVVTVLGFAAGLGLTAGAAALIGWALPTFSVELSTAQVGGVFGLALGMGALSAAVPARPVARIDPAEVFRA